MMKKFFIMTRGRTGSTAILDELSKIDSIRAAQELFIKRDFREDFNTLNKLKFWQQYLVMNQFMIPFELWKLRASWWQNCYRNLVGDKGLVNYFLNALETRALRDKVHAFGFKVLSNHFEENPSLKTVLLQREYLVIYLKRNIPRQVISGMVANRRGIHNAHIDEKYEDNDRYLIDTVEFQELVRWEAQAVENDIAFLDSAGFNYIVVSYEEFTSNREQFFRNVLGFLGVPMELPQASQYTVMIKDLEHTIENFQAVADCASAMGMQIE